MTAGTIFDRTRTPLTVWFTACWMFASDKGGISASGVQRALEIGLPDRVDDAAPAALGPHPSRPRAARRPGRGR
ncbi:MAG: hypothetical protein GEU90_22345 [Gemmatimonas sp.]|nr:hypothetical protein [Gemmatimonas sp.]